MLLTHPGVLEAAVVGRPHADWGEEVVAFVVAARGRRASRPAALDRLCLDNIARFKRPKGYRFVDELAEEQLRQDAEDRAAPAAPKDES